MLLEMLYTLVFEGNGFEQVLVSWAHDNCQNDGHDRGLSWDMARNGDCRTWNGIEANLLKAMKEQKNDVNGRLGERSAVEYLSMEDFGLNLQPVP